jgi:hypothetical protein
VRLRASLLLTLRGLAFFADEGRRTGDVRTAAGADRVFGGDSLFRLLWSEADRVTILFYADIFLRPNILEYFWWIHRASAL